MTTAKYVVIKYPVPVGETSYVFPEFINHAVFARGIAPERDIVSAGFIEQRCDCSFHCSGRSESLGLDARPDDTMLANIMFGRI